jgi:hypothetical protein
VHAVRAKLHRQVWSVIYQHRHAAILRAWNDVASEFEDMMIRRRNAVARLQPDLQRGHVARIQSRIKLARERGLRPAASADKAQAASQPLGFTMRLAEAGDFTSISAARGGRATSGPPQFGHLPFSVCSAQSAQKVHSNEQIRASLPDGSRSLSQHSQLGRISSMHPD